MSASSEEECSDANGEKKDGFHFERDRAHVRWRLHRIILMLRGMRDFGVASFLLGEFLGIESGGGKVSASL